MGTKGATGLRKAVIGSNTASMIAESSIPVLAVPEDASIRTIRNVIYATDLKNLEMELNTLIPYVKQFDCVVHILHIVESGSDIELAEVRIQEIVAQSGYNNVVTLVTFSPDIDEAIDHYITLSKADMLAMFTHEPTFFEKVFDQSITRKMAFHSKIPLLAFKNK
jgi:nucleotide-binding universal stress UspA family protein